jgi:hypothetical protein
VQPSRKKKVARAARRETQRGQRNVEFLLLCAS